MAYKVLIAEDEKEKAKGIAYLVEKYSPECTPVLLAHDGQEGYEKALAEKPDIILTDACYGWAGNDPGAAGIRIPGRVYRIERICRVQLC